MNFVMDVVNTVLQQDLKPILDFQIEHAVVVMMLFGARLFTIDGKVHIDGVVVAVKTCFILDVCILNCAGPRRGRDKNIVDHPLRLMTVVQVGIGFAGTWVEVHSN